MKESKKTKCAHAGAAGLEKLTKELATPTALVSATQEGGIPSKMIGGITSTLEGGYRVIEGLATNMRVGELLGHVGDAAWDAGKQMTGNLWEQPTETLYAALATYATVKAAPYVSKMVRSHYRNKPYKNNNAENAQEQYAASYGSVH